VLEKEFAEYLSRTIAERDISSNRQPTVQIVADAAVKPGKSRVVATFSTVPSPAPASGDRGVTLYAPSVRDRRQAEPPIAPGPKRAPRTKLPALEIRNHGGELLRRFELTDAVTIGRGRAADLMLTDTRISREHVRIDRDATGAFTVSDLRSLNGTLVNGELLRGSRRLHDGDLLEIGEFRLRFVAGATR
jgi:hypothetical protein